MPGEARKVVDRLVHRQFFRGLGNTVFVKVFRRGAGYPPKPAKGTSNKGGVIQLSCSDHAIHALLNEIDLPIAHTYHQVDIRIKPIKVFQIWHDDEMGDPTRHINPQTSLRSFCRIHQAGFRMLD